MGYGVDFVVTAWVLLILPSLSFQNVLSPSFSDLIHDIIVESMEQRHGDVIGDLILSFLFLFLLMDFMWIRLLTIRLLIGHYT